MITDVGSPWKMPINVKWSVVCDPDHSFNHNRHATIKRSDQADDSRVHNGSAQGLER